ncbi:MAG: hypothetical protein PHS93_09940 [Candidatus Omnitrophica bacterium]|nr:hypothetical protein [Candidatus Omnitrophota bacterium]MDD5353470.1 hypothetical protein [Candidatus Omnitrophota bacterium]
MKNFYRLFIYGAKIHPGNFIYLMMLVLGPVAGSTNKSAAPLTGGLFGLSLVVVLLLPLYIYTSYQVGKANAPQNAIETSAQPLTQQGGFEDSTQIYPRCPQCGSSAWFEAEFSQLRCSVCGKVIAGKLPPC